MRLLLDHGRWQGVRLCTHEVGPVDRHAQTASPNFPLFRPGYLFLHSACYTIFCSCYDLTLPSICSLFGNSDCPCCWTSVVLNRTTEVRAPPLCVSVRALSGELFVSFGLFLPQELLFPFHNLLAELRASYSFCAQFFAIFVRYRVDFELFIGREVPCPWFSLSCAHSHHEMVSSFAFVLSVGIIL